MSIDFYNNLNSQDLDLLFNIDMTNIYDRYLKYLSARAYILDAGCGVGRDVNYFKQQGFQVDAFDASEKLVSYARLRTNLDIKLMCFEDFNALNQYDGIFCCASLLHFKNFKLNFIISKLYLALKNSGVFYTCFKMSNKCHDKSRYFNKQTPRSIKKIFKRHNFKILEVFITYDKLNRSNKWLNIIAQK